MWHTGNSSGSPRTATADQSVALVDARTNAVSHFPLALPPARLALDTHTLWLADVRDLTLARFDLKGRRIEQTIGLGLTPDAIATGEGAVWVLSNRTLVRVDPAFGFVKARTLPIALPDDISVGNPAGLAVGAGSVWVEDGVSTLLRVDPRTSAVTRRFALGKGIDGVALDAGSVWVTRGSPATLLRIDPRTDSVTAPNPSRAAYRVKCALPDRVTGPGPRGRSGS